MIVAAMAVIGFIVAACKSSKNAGETHESMSESQRLAEEYPYKRAWGEGVRANKMDARWEAELIATRQLSARMEQMVQEVGNYATAGKDNSIASEEATEKLQKAMAVLSSDIKAGSKNVVSGHVIIKTDVFRKANGQYRVEVCMEVDPSMVAKKTTSHLKQILSESEREELENQLKQFQEDSERWLNRRGGE